MTSWYELLKIAMHEDGEDFERRVCTLDETALKKEFDNGYGLEEGAPFTAWGEKWVYFPIRLEIGACVGHAPRHPCDIAMEHQGC